MRTSRPTPAQEGRRHGQPGGRRDEAAWKASERPSGAGRDAPPPHAWLAPLEPDCVGRLVQALLRFPLESGHGQVWRKSVATSHSAAAQRRAQEQLSAGKLFENRQSSAPRRRRQGTSVPSGDAMPGRPWKAAMKTGVWRQKRPTKCAAGRYLPAAARRRHASRRRRTGLSKRLNLQSKSTPGPARIEAQ